MEDILKELSKGAWKFRLRIYEHIVHPSLNDLELCKWEVSFWQPETQWWFILATAGDSLMKKFSIMHGEKMLKFWSENYPGPEIIEEESASNLGDVIEEQAAHPLRVLTASGETLVVSALTIAYDTSAQLLDIAIERLKLANIGWEVRVPQRLNPALYVDVGGFIIHLPDDTSVLTTKSLAAALTEGYDRVMRHREHQRELHKPEVGRDGKK